MFKVKYRSRDIDYPNEPWWEVWWKDDNLICGFSTKQEADDHASSLNDQYFLMLDLGL